MRDAGGIDSVLKMKMTQKIKESSEKQKVENFEKIDSVLKTKMAQKIIEKRKSMNRKPMERNFKKDLVCRNEKGAEKER